MSSLHQKRGRKSTENVFKERFISGEIFILVETWKGLRAKLSTHDCLGTKNKILNEFT